MLEGETRMELGVLLYYSTTITTTTTPLRYVKKCRNFGQALEFLKDFCYKPNQLDPNNSQIIAFLESKFLNDKFLNTPKGCTYGFSHSSCSLGDQGLEYW